MKRKLFFSLSLIPNLMKRCSYFELAFVLLNLFLHRSGGRCDILSVCQLLMKACWNSNEKLRLPFPIYTSSTNTFIQPEFKKNENKEEEERFVVGFLGLIPDGYTIFV